MSSQSYWFYLESYVHVFVKSKHVLLYDALSGSSLEYLNDDEIVDFVRRVKSSKQLYVLKLSKTYLDKRPKIMDFIRNVRERFMGDLLDSSVVKHPPFQMMPNLSLPKDVRRVKKEPDRSVGEKIMSYLKELTIHVNSSCDLTCSSCRGAYKQLIFCRRNKGGKELPIQQISQLMKEASSGSLTRLNIVGGNIFQYSAFDELTALMNRFPVSKTYHVHYANMEGKGKYLEMLAPTHSSLNILMNGSIDDVKFSNVYNIIAAGRIKASFTFLLETEEEIACAQDIIQRFNIDDALLRLYYNSKNLDLFEKYVFIKDKSMILGSKPTSKDIFARMAVNPVDFGKISVADNGNFYANLNAPMIGKIGKDSLYDVLFKEMNAGRSWRKLRTNVAPCRNCAFSLLCPPVSNYERVIGRYNLCHISQ